MTVRILAAIAASSLALWGSAASAVQVPVINDLVATEEGEIFPYGNFEMPAEGQRILAKIEYSGMTMIYGELVASYELRTIYYLPEGYLSGDEVAQYVVCSTANGCLQLVRPGLAYVRFETPRGFDRECTPATVGDCSNHYGPPNIGGSTPSTFDFAFQRDSVDGPFDLKITIGDPTAIPEPTTWALMIAGFGLVGSALRRTRYQIARG